MATSAVKYSAIIMQSRKCSLRPMLTQVKAQSHRDEAGRSWHFDDAHLQMLRERIQKVKIKERLEKCLVCKQGWNFLATTASTCYDKKPKKRLGHVSQSVELFCLVCVNVSFTILVCTLCLYFTSILIHLNV